MLTTRSHVTHRSALLPQSIASRRPPTPSDPERRPRPEPFPDPDRSPDHAPHPVPANDDDADAVREVPLAVPFGGSVPFQRAVPIEATTPFEKAASTVVAPDGPNPLLPPPAHERDDGAARLFRLHAAIAAARSSGERSVAERSSVAGPSSGDRHGDPSPLSLRIDADDPRPAPHDHPALANALVPHVARMLTIGDRWRPRDARGESCAELRTLYPITTPIAELAAIPHAERPWTVYAILDPRTELPVYVGMSGQPGRRLERHRLWASERPLQHARPRRMGTYRYLPMLGEAGLRPRFVRLQGATSRSDALRKERAWMDRLTALGVPLLNRIAPERLAKSVGKGADRAVASTKKPATTTKRAASEAATCRGAAS